MKIYVIRHGLTPLNKREILNGRIDESLAPEGIEQAKLASSLLPPTIRHIYVSPLKRTRETADILNAERKLPITIHDELIEIHFGSFTGKSWTTIDRGEEYMRKHRGVEYDYRPEGECVDDVKKRLLGFLHTIYNTHADGEALIVTHGGIVRTLQVLEKGSADHRINNATFHTFDARKIIESGMM